MLVLGNCGARRGETGGIFPLQTWVRLFFVRFNLVSESFDSTQLRAHNGLKSIDSNAITTQNGFMKLDSNLLTTQKKLP